MSQASQPVTAATLESLQAENRDLRTKCEQYRELYLTTLEQCRKLELGLRGQKAERLPTNDAQLTMDILATLLGDDEESEAKPEPEIKPISAHQRRKPTGRKPLPKHLPRVDVEVIPPEVQREGLDAFERIGEEVCETIERRPSSIVVVRTRRPKFIRKEAVRASQETTDILIAETPELPIERGLAGPGMLADTIVRRWEDHLPAHRLEAVYGREGLQLSRSTICGWHSQLAELARPLTEAMWSDAFESPYLCTDADAHTVYDRLYVGGDIVEVACWAHARRYFFKSLSSAPDLARRALAFIKSLFLLERSVATAPRKKKEAVRREKSRPLVEQFFSWCDEQALTVLDDTPISKAVGYARNQRDALQRFLDDGRIPPDNGAVERLHVRTAVGRKNWLFVGSDDGGAVNAPNAHQN